MTRTEFGMFEHYRRYPWVLPTYQYSTVEELLANLGTAVIAPAEEKVGALRG
jgi:hypothetical protein